MRPASGNGVLATTSSAEKVSKINILVVISSHKAANLIRDLFLQLGFSNIFVARDAADAVQMLREIRVHLIVADSELRVSPKDAQTAEEIELSGIRFVERLRHAQQSPAPFIPVLMLMDHARSHEVRRARDAGVNEVILRPMQARDFCARVVNLIDKPRVFITAPSFKGPCRRHQEGPPPGVDERRVREVRLIRCDEMKGKCT